MQRVRRRCGAFARRRGAVVGVAAAVVVVSLAAPVGATPRPHEAALSTRRGAFAWLVPAAPPVGWPNLVAPDVPATLAYPPSFRPVGGDPGSVSAAVAAPPGPYIAYLNATPRQGAERPRGFAAFRVHLVSEDHDESVRLEAARERLPFQGGTGSCVIDRYVTRVGHHHYREIACLVVDAHGAGAVVVAAARTSAWAQYAGQLMTAIRAFSIG
jgi:hypothetical protein